MYKRQILWLLVPHFFNSPILWGFSILAIAAIASTRVILEKHRAQDAIAGVLLGVLAATVVIYFDAEILRGTEILKV